MSSIENIPTQDSIVEPTYLGESEGLRSQTVAKIGNLSSHLSNENNEIYASNLLRSQELITNECLQNVESNDFCINILNEALLKQNTQLS